ncbi:uncharacterized protein DNG_05997 [Cephalotrichum gorgonifer]|uniref:Uncharacterized protein n=1 Tax=Cephalotrichum gorgonifer TaxID=2041049 RepID=A0AAE8SW24_9PEZI|nr:uncharacterized protein DNG_05997 [Cephalotrichum gorgonifer]
MEQCILVMEYQLQGSYRGLIQAGQSTLVSDRVALPERENGTTWILFFDCPSQDKT